MITFVEKPLVSVLIPTYNKAEYIGEAIESVLKQTYKDFELIVIDDCSSDNTSDIVNQFISDKRIKFYRNERNLGIGGNWNKTLEYASGKYIKFLMADDKFEPTMLQKYVEIMEKYPEISLVSSYRGVFGEKNDIIKQPLNGYIDRKKAVEMVLKHGNWIGEPTTVMFRRKNLWVGSFKVEFRFLLDIDMWLRQLTCGDLYIIPEVLTWFRQHKGQVTKEIKQSYNDIFEWYLLFEMVYYSKDKFFINEIIDADKIKKKNFLKNYKKVASMLREKRYNLVWNCFRIAIKEGIFTIFFIKTLLYFLKSMWRSNGY